VRDLEQHTGFGMAIWTVQQTIAQNTCLPGEEAVEAPNSGDLRLQVVSPHSLTPLLFAIVYLMLA
jgi:hypothetical protein